MTRWTRGCLAAFFIFSQRILMMPVRAQPENLQYNLWSRKYVDAQGCLLLQEGRLLLQEIAQITVSKVSTEMKIPLQSVLFFSFTFSSLENMCVNCTIHISWRAPESLDDIRNNDDVDRTNSHDGRSQHRGWRSKVKRIFHHLRLILVLARHRRTFDTKNPMFELTCLAAK